MVGRLGIVQNYHFYAFVVLVNKVFESLFVFFNYLEFTELESLLFNSDGRKDIERNFNRLIRNENDETTDAKALLLRFFRFLLP